MLPQDLEVTAREYGALVRRKKIPDASALLRMALAYAVSDLSLKDVAAWARALGIAEITGPGLFYRLREGERWLEKVLGQVLSDGVETVASGLDIRVVDASVVTGPGSTGTDWLIHACIDPRTGRLTSVEITGNDGAESYRRYDVKPGQVLLGDRGYCNALGIARVVESGGEVLVRFNPHSIRVCDMSERLLGLLAYEGGIDRKKIVSWDVLVPVPPQKNGKTRKGWKLSQARDWIPARVLAQRTDANTVTWLLTTLPLAKLSDEAAFTLYRIRWQVELLFKRLKTQLRLKDLPTREGPTAKSWLLCRLLAAVLAQRLVETPGAFSPTGPGKGKTRSYA